MYIVQLQTYVRKCLRNNISVVPIAEGKKYPEGITNWQKLMPKEENYRLFKQNNGIGYVCGEVSGNLECLDFDDPFKEKDNLHNYETKSNVAKETIISFYRQLKEIDTNIYEIIAINGLVTKTPGNGYHIWFRTEGKKEKSGNQKLTKRRCTDRRDGEIKFAEVIETRGDGGQAVDYPTKGYKLLKGSFGRIPAITEEQRKVIFAVAKMINEEEETGSEHRTTGSKEEEKKTSSGIKPGEDFDRKTTTEDFIGVLTQDGWKIHHKTRSKFGTGYYFTRPGKKDKAVSASLNVIGEKPNMFYNFSSSVGNIPTEKSIGAFAYKTFTRHNGNFSESAKELSGEGYGTKTITLRKQEMSKSTIEDAQKIAQTASQKFDEGKSEKEIVESEKEQETDIENVKDNPKIQIPEKYRFWYIDVTKDGQASVKINNYKLLNYLEYKGNWRILREVSKSIEYVKIEGNIIKSGFEKNDISRFIKKVIEELPSQLYVNEDGSKTEIKGISKKSLLDNYEEKKLEKIMSGNFLNQLPYIEDKFLKDTATVSYLFFKNGVLKVEKNKPHQMIPYENANGYIWENNIIQRDYIEIEDFNADECNFLKFLENVCSEKAIGEDGKEYRELDKPRLNALLTGIGYMLSRYKDDKNAVAVVLCEETIGDLNDDCNGRTGKSLIVRAIMQMRNGVMIDAKRFDQNDRFNFQKVRKGMTVISLDDLPMKFKFDYLFARITGDFEIERKGKDVITLPFNESPKIMITTNFVITGNTDSYKDRKHEIEMSNYYGADRKPSDDFGGVNFYSKEWNEKKNEKYSQFQLFDNLMVECLQMFLDKGLIKYEQRNTEQRRLNALVPVTFVDFAEEFVGRINRGEFVSRQEIYNQFVENFGKEYPRINSTQTTRWFKLVLEFHKLRTNMFLPDLQRILGKITRGWQLKHIDPKYKDEEPF